MSMDEGSTPKVNRRLAAILAADIGGYSALIGIDEEATVRDLKAHPIVGEYGGTIIYTAGDGFLAEFSSVVNAVKCALAIQEVMVERNAPIDPAKRMQFRIGVNQGDVVSDDTQVHGIGVYIAVRLRDAAEPGGICISGKVHDELIGKIHAEFEDRGQQSLKNIAVPVRVYRRRASLPGNPVSFERRQVTERQQRRLAAILAADMVGYSTLMGADEERTVRDLKSHQAVVLPMIGELGGRIIDTAGDGILAEFGSVLGAVDCALAIQKIMAERNADIDPAKRMQFRIGINQGDVIVDDVRVYGDGVNVAARIESIAEPGGICVSGKVHDEIAGKVDITCQDLGLQELKNIAARVRVYRVLPRTEAPTASLLTLPDHPSIAVLPFTNMSGDPEQEYFADGVVEDIITGLSRIRWLFVIARNSSFTYKARTVDVRQIGRELGVRYVLEGSMRKAGRRVRVTGQLIDATTGVHIWADRFDGDLGDIFALQDRITKRALQQSPANPVPLRYLSSALAHLGRNKEAQHVMRQLIRCQPNVSLSRVNPNYRHDWMKGTLIEGLKAAGMPE